MEDKTITISVTHYGETYSWSKQKGDEVEFLDFMEAVKQLSKAMWQEDLVEEYWS